MKSIFSIALCAFWLGGLTAQTRTTNKNTKSSTQYSKSTNTRKNSHTTNNSQPVSVRDRINQRLRDSAAAAKNNTTTTTVINGIKVPATSTANQNANRSTSANTTTTNTTTGSGSSSTTTGGNSVTNTGVQANQTIPGTVPVTPSNPANVPGKPATREQVRSNTTDINRVQMNAINGNQAASQAQNPDNTTKSVTGNMIGESQWGTNQVGENQWTPPNAIISGFTRDFPEIRGATWTRDNAGTFSARYRSGELWSSSTYSTTGTQLETRTELPVVGTLPEPVTSFRSRQGGIGDLTRISKISRPGRETLYEIRLNNGRVAYLNNNGQEVPFQ